MLLFDGIFGIVIRSGSSSVGYCDVVVFVRGGGCGGGLLLLLLVLCSGGNVAADASAEGRLFRNGDGGEMIIIR